jgi:DNA-directed RNA polymerase specialized sigma24 family protein
VTPTKLIETHYRDARNMMRKLWRRQRWPTWLRDEWEGEAALALMEAAATFNGSVLFTTWLWRICRCCVWDWRRKADSRRRMEAECRRRAAGEGVCDPDLVVPAELWSNISRRVGEDLLHRRYFLEQTWQQIEDEMGSGPMKRKQRRLNNVIREMQDGIEE